MATYKQIGYGSKGSDVTELQKLLNSNGYSLKTDGIYGANTQAAVKDYQKKNNLSVDGIAGDQTWGALTKNNTTQPATGTGTTSATGTSASSKDTSSKGFTYDDFKASASTLAADKNRQSIASQKPGDFSYGEYQKSDVVQQAEALLQQQIANKPGEYQSQWQAQLDDTLNKILNREKFSYDLNGDALYQQYKDQYMLQGQQAMMDTMGQAQAMTGGYGNSYAQTVGQQTYQGYLQQLNDRVPELYQLALNQYNREGEDLYNQYGLYADRENQDYSRYRDTVSDYNAELDRLTNDARYQSETDYNRYMDQYNMAYGQHRDSVSDWQQAQARADEDYWNQYERDYGQWADGRDFAYGQFADDRAYGYQVDRDKAADEQWQKEFDEAKRQFDLQYALETGASSSGSSGGGSSAGTGGSGNGSNNGSGNGSGGGVNNSGYSADLVKRAQAYVGATPDGQWGSKSAAAAGDQGYTSLTQVLNAMGLSSNGALAGNQGSKPTETPKPAEPKASQYAGWSAGTWEAYFAKIRQSEGKEAAQEELNYFTSKGLIPKNMVTYASSGARGGQMGH